jgi:hypothetical protein
MKFPDVVMYGAHIRFWPTLEKYEAEKEVELWEVEL